MANDGVYQNGYKGLTKEYNMFLKGVAQGLIIKELQGDKWVLKYNFFGAKDCDAKYLLGKHNMVLICKGAIKRLYDFCMKLCFIIYYFSCKEL